LHIWQRNSQTPGGKNHGMPCFRFGRFYVGGKLLLQSFYFRRKYANDLSSTVSYAMCSCIVISMWLYCLSFSTWTL
jgi:hypothetical protein